MYPYDYLEEPRHTHHDRFVVVQLWGRRLSIYSLKDVNIYQSVGIDIEPLSDPMTMDEAKAMWKLIEKQRSQ